MVLPISHNLNDTTFFLTHYYSSLLFTTTIKFARARELELKIQNKHRNTQFPSLSLSLNGRRKQHLRSCTLQIPSKFQFPYHFISTTFYLFIIISFTFQDLIHAIFKLVWTRRALGLRNLLSLFKFITFFNLCSWNHFPTSVFLFFFVFWVFSFSERERNDVADALDCEVC